MSTKTRPRFLRYGQTHDTHYQLLTKMPTLAEDEADVLHSSSEESDAHSDIVVDVSVDTPSAPPLSPPVLPTKPTSGICIVCLEHVVMNNTQTTSDTSPPPPLAAPLLPHPRDLSDCTCQYDAHAACLREWYAYKRECPMCRKPVQQPRTTTPNDAHYVLPYWTSNNDTWYTRCNARVQHIFYGGTCNCACVVVFGVLFFGWLIVGQVVGAMQDEHAVQGNVTGNPWSPDMGFL